MEDLYELRDMLQSELEDYGRKGSLRSGSLDVVDKLAHTIKNIDRIIANNRMSDSHGRYEGTYEGSYDDGSYRGRKRDSMGRYSRAAEDMMESLREIERQAPNEKLRQEIMRLTNKVEQMM